jgi:hypothetical protein
MVGKPQIIVTAKIDLVTIMSLYDWPLRRIDDPQGAMVA